MGLTLALTTAEQGTVLLLVAALAAPLAAAMFAGSAKAWRSIGKGPFAIESQAPRRSGGGGEARERAERAAEVRQMLAAKAERRRRRGEAPLDVEAEARRLLGPAADLAALEAAREAEESRDIS